MKKIIPHTRIEFTNVGVYGLNGLGSSLAKALRRAGGFNVVGCEKDASVLEYAFDHDLIQLGGRETAILRGTSVIFVCAEQAENERAVSDIWQAVGDSALITDTARVKGGLMRRLPKGMRFAGGRPCVLAPSDITCADAEIFEGACYYLAPACGIDDLAELKKIVAILGAKPVEVTADENDLLLAGCEQLPALIAYLTSRDAGEPSLAYVRATAPALTDPLAFAQDAAANESALTRALSDFLIDIAAAKQALGDADKLPALLMRGHVARKGLLAAGFTEHTLTLEKDGKNGFAARVLSILSKGGIEPAGIYTDHAESAGLKLDMKSHLDFEAAVKLLSKKKYRIVLRSSKPH